MDIKREYDRLYNSFYIQKVQNSYGNFDIDYLVSFCEYTYNLMLYTNVEVGIMYMSPKQLYMQQVMKVIDTIGYMSTQKMKSQYLFYNFGKRGYKHMFGRTKNTIPDVKYDPEYQRAVIRCSVCTGEQVAGFKDVNTGKFTEVCVIKTEKDLLGFMKKYGLKDVAKEY